MPLKPSQKPMQALVAVGAKRDPNQESIRLALLDEDTGEPLIIGSGSGEPVAQHVVSAENVLLLPASRNAPVVIGTIPITTGLYQMMLYAEFDAPDQGDGTPPSILAHMDGVELYQQGQGLNMPVNIFQGNLGPTQFLTSDRTFAGLTGDLEFSLSIEDSSVADTDSAVPVTIDRVFLSLLG